MDRIDLRSDTVTLPTPQMRAAMANAELGDDVMGEDPTVNRLEALAAERMNKPAALFVASGTMANIVALLTHCGRGDEAIVGDKAHSFINEAGGMAALGGIHPRTLPNQSDGSLKLDDIKNAIVGMSRNFSVTPEQLMKFYTSKEGSLDRLKNSIFEEKVLDLILSKAVVVKGE